MVNAEEILKQKAYERMSQETFRGRCDALLRSIAQANGGIPSDEVARAAVRLCRAVDEEVASPTPWPKPPEPEEDTEF